MFSRYTVLAAQTKREIVSPASAASAYKGKDVRWGQVFCRSAETRHVGN